MFGEDPNITGSFNDLLASRQSLQGGRYEMGDARGVFATNPQGITGNISTVTESSEQNLPQQGSSSDGIGFDASRYSTLYNGTTLQPKGLSVLPCIRT